MSGVEEIVTSCVTRHRASKHGELEFRLGSYASGEFRPGVSKEIFDELLRDMHESELHEMQWCEVVDYYYSIRKSDPVRSRVVYDTENIAVTTEHTCKRTVQSAVLACGGDGTEVVRVSHATETPVEPPRTCLPTHVRIKQRKRFSDVRDNDEVWIYELSKTWSASSRSAVEHMQHVSPPVYEVECELSDVRREYLNALSDCDVARSIIAKSRLLLGEEGDYPVDLVHEYTAKERKEVAHKMVRVK